VTLRWASPAANFASLSANFWVGGLFHGVDPATD